MSRVSEGIPAFGQWAKQRRLSLALTQAVLAKSIGCAVATLQKIEQGARTPSAQVAELLAHALRLQEDDVPAFVAAARSGVAPVFRTVISAAARVDDLLGRDAQFALLASTLVERKHRIVTLTGPGGIGKTSLALALAHALSGQFEAGARVVSLAEAHTPELVLGVTIRALVTEANIASLPALLKALRTRRQLIVFDNFEHVLPAAELVEQLATVAPGVVLLVTSREALGVLGEYVVEVRSLPRDAARALFIRHAQLADPRWRLSPDDTPIIDALCRAFDGLPLAIQLCAARVAVMPPALLFRRLLSEQGLPRIDLAADGLSDLPLRQHSLEDTIRWSYDLLSDAEQHAFQRMAVFVGGAELRAAEALLGEPTSAWNLLAALIQKSLLVRNRAPGGPRFAPLETVRAFAIRQAAREGTWEAIQRDHLRYYLALAEANEQLTSFPERIAAQESEAPNLYAAMSYAWRNDAVSAMRLFRAMLKFWRTRVRFGDQLSLAEEGLAGLPDDAHGWLGELQLQAGSACIALERIDDAAQHLTQADSLLQLDSSAAALWLWRVRDLQGLLAERCGDLEGAITLHRAAAALSPTPAEAARTNIHVGRAAAMSGRFAEAETVLEQAMAMLRPEDENMALALLLLAHVRTMLGKLDDAASLLLRCEALAESFRFYDWRGGIYQAQGSLAYLRGDPGAALRALDQARVEYAAITDDMPALMRCERVRALLHIEAGRCEVGLPLLCTSLQGVRFAGTSVAGIAALSGLAAVLRWAGQDTAAGAALAYVAHTLATQDLRARVFVDATPLELVYVRNSVQRFGSAHTNSELGMSLDDAIARAVKALKDSSTQRVAVCKAD
jgi:predicted ATPase/DNA-binding XRE family transcriptional regulator